MLKAMSTYVVVRERLHNGLLDGFARGGAQAIEIFAARGHFDYTNPQHVREIASWFRATPDVAFHSMHAPMFADADWGRSGEPPLNIASRERKTRIDSMDEIKRAIEVAEHAQFRFLVQHVGVGGESCDEYKIEAALSSLEHLQAFARPLGVRVLLENIPNELSIPEKLLEIRTSGHFDDLGFCLDFGHAHIAEGFPAAFELMKPHIRSTHVHDNNKDRDSHLWPTEGTLDWNEALTVLRTAPHVPPVLLEIEGDPNGDPAFSRALPERMQKTWEKLKL
jgi:sugar phosphate isomerase/epimerase